MNIAFAGFRHSHIYGLYKSAVENPEVTITGCCEENEEARLAAEKEIGSSFKYNSYEELLQDPSVEAVAIGDYFQKRGGMIIAALKAGKHVICDKPLCTSLE
ncbi:MAG: Gfo/Idh/MocA family oxidoreductase, partial [Firmicutes bacterium]|nr:Gfo/Idh/MocA family oxidoreductase [Bacillota bacterium]